MECPNIGTLAGEGSTPHLFVRVTQQRTYGENMR
jgi:hypothetical protein